MQVSVPQFIDVEDRIVGPFTTKQFIIMVVAAAFLFGFYALLPLSVFIIIAIPVVAAVGAFAFLKINGRPLPELMTASFAYIRKPRERIWKRTVDMALIQKKVEVQMAKENTQQSQAAMQFQQLPQSQQVAIGMQRGNIERLSTLLDTSGEVRSGDRISQLEQEVARVYGDQAPIPHPSMSPEQRQDHIRQYLGR